MSDRRLTSSLAAAIEGRMLGSGVIPSLVMGTCVDAGQRPTVILEGTTAPRECRCAGDPPGPGERVWVIRWLTSFALVIGRAGGSNRLLGYAEEDQDDTFTTQETMGGLTFDVQVTQPGRVIVLWGAAQFTVDTPTANVIGEFTWDGADNGRYFRHAFPLAATGEFGSGFALVVNPDPGVYTVTLDATCNGGTGTFAGATTPGYLLAVDGGNLGGTMT